MEPRSQAPTGRPHTPARLWAGVVVVYLLIPLILFLGAGDIGWWQAWIFSALIVLAGVLGRWLAERRRPGLVADRVKDFDAQNAKPWDRVLSRLMSLSFSFPLVIVAGLDHRWGPSAAFPTWLTLLGLALIGLGYALAAWALVENPFFSGVVRIQTERGHVVCDRGPYRLMRHPGYAGNLLALPGVVLAFSSLWTLIPAAAALVIAVVRTVLEDRTLQEELPGYREYALRVRYRLLPGVY